MYVTVRQRLTSAIAAGIMLALIAAMVIYGLAAASSQTTAIDPLTAITTVPSPPPAPPPAPRPRNRPNPAARQAASPRNLRNQATQVTAPILTPLIVAPPVIAAPQPGTGSAVNNGASDRIGPGQGAGGLGNGMGGGGDGDGDGDYTPPVLVSGDRSLSAVANRLLDDGSGARLEARYNVGIDGRISGCVITVASGNAELDRIACPSIERMLRYRPSRDDRNRPVSAIVERRFSWTIDRSAIEPGGN